MSTYRVEMAFYVEADSANDAQLIAEDGISSRLGANYDLMDVTNVSVSEWD